MNTRQFAFLAAATFACVPVLGAQFLYSTNEPFTNRFVSPAGYLVLSGEIVPGDYERLLSKIGEDPDRFFVHNTLVLASNGGSVSEAIKIANLVKSLFTRTTVGPVTGRCVSACFLVFAASNERSSDDEGLIGIHRPYIVNSELAALSPTEAAVAQTQVLTRARTFLQDSGVPVYLIEEMFRRPSTDVYWLSAHDLQQLGARSPWFDQYLVAKCGWDQAVVNAAATGDNSLNDKVVTMTACRARMTRPAGRAAWAKAARDDVQKRNMLVQKLLDGLPRCHAKGTVDRTTDECPN